MTGLYQAMSDMISGMYTIVSAVVTRPANLPGAYHVNDEINASANGYLTFHDIVRENGGK
jgi:hypothetical protein